LVVEVASEALLDYFLTNEVRAGIEKSTPDEDREIVA
jgi:hypothetical protein